VAVSNSAGETIPFRRSAAVLDRVEAVGADADPAWFPTDGLVHLDLLVSPRSWIHPL
jgi:hypothetical protein